MTFNFRTDFYVHCKCNMSQEHEMEDFLWETYHLSEPSHKDLCADLPIRIRVYPKGPGDVRIRVWLENPDLG